MFKRANLIAFSPFIFGIIIYSLIAWNNATTANTSPISQNTAPPISFEPDKKVKLYLIDFGIRFITGKHEEEIEQWDKKGCDLDFLEFKRTFDNDFSQVYKPTTYQKYDARGKFTLENEVYYFDSQGILNHSFDGFNHINKQQISQLVQANCKN